MIRDFSDETLSIMFSYCDEYEAYQESGVAAGELWETDLSYEQLDEYIYYSMDSAECMKYLDHHHKTLVSQCLYTKEVLNNIFTKINELDDGLPALIEAQTEMCYNPYVNAIQGLIDCIGNPATGKSIFDDPLCFSDALNKIKEGALDEILDEIDPDRNGGNWGPLENILAKDPEELTVVEMAAINKMMMDCVDIDVDGNITFLQNSDDAEAPNKLEEIYRRFYDKHGPIFPGYYPHPAVKKILEYQEEYALDMAERYSYVFNYNVGSSSELSWLDQKRKAMVYEACAISDITYCVSNLSPWTNKIKDNVISISVSENANSPDSITISCTDRNFVLKETVECDVQLYNRELSNTYQMSENTALEHQKINVNNVVVASLGKVLEDEGADTIIEKIPVVDDVVGVIGAPLDIYEAYDEAVEHNKEIDDKIRANNTVLYADAFGGTASVVEVNGQVCIRNVVIDEAEARRRIEYLNSTHSDNNQGCINYDADKLLQDYVAYCNGSPASNELVEFSKEMLTTGKEDAYISSQQY